jgi:hypothetical protein
MAKNLSQRMRQVAGLDLTHGHLPPEQRQNDSGAVDMRSREQERRVRVRVLLAERSKESPRA